MKVFSCNKTGLKIIIGMFAKKNHAKWIVITIGWFCFSGLCGKWVSLASEVIKNEFALANSFFEASTGFEPVMRVLQTLALPLGHDAMLHNEDC